MTITLSNNVRLNLGMYKMTMLYIFYQSFNNMSVPSRPFEPENLRNTLAKAYKILFPDNSTGHSYSAMKKQAIRAFKERLVYYEYSTMQNFWLYMDRLTDDKYKDKVKGWIEDAFKEPTFSTGQTVIVDRTKVIQVPMSGCSSLAHYIRTNFGYAKEKMEMGKVDESGSLIWIMFADRKLEGYLPKDVRLEKC